MLWADQVKGGLTWAPRLVKFLWVVGSAYEGPLSFDSVETADRPLSKTVVGFQYAEGGFDDAPAFYESTLIVRAKVFLALIQYGFGLPQQDQAWYIKE